MTAPALERAMSATEIPPGVEVEKVFLVEAQYTPDSWLFGLGAVIRPK